MAHPRRIHRPLRKNELPNQRVFNDMLRAAQASSGPSSGVPGYVGPGLAAPRQDGMPQFRLVQMLDTIMMPCSNYIGDASAPHPSPRVRAPDSYDKECVVIPFQGLGYNGWPYDGDLSETFEKIKVSNCFPHKYFLKGMRFWVMWHAQAGQWVPIDATPSRLAIRHTENVSAGTFAEFTIYSVDSAGDWTSVAKTVYCLAVEEYTAGNDAYADWIPGEYDATLDLAGCWTIVAEEEPQSSSSSDSSGEESSDDSSGGSSGSSELSSSGESDVSSDVSSGGSELSSDNSDISSDVSSGGDCSGLAGIDLSTLSVSTEPNYVLGVKDGCLVRVPVTECS